ncbi:hypothetical protein F52700_3178 [Fusarium sp. NRRL 52700]|nr:hypothetical protein F52700_3178 [Fusarium sp. NRRL 52700]
MPPLADPVLGAATNATNGKHNGGSRRRSTSPRRGHGRGHGRKRNRHRNRSRHGRSRGQRRSDDEHQDPSPPVPSDDDELTEDIVESDTRVVTYRPANSFVNAPEQLTKREKFQIFMLLRPIQNTRDPRYRLTYNYWNNILNSLFDHWNTNLGDPANPILPDRPVEQTFIDGGTLKSDQPLPNARRRACRPMVEDYRTRGAVVRLGVSINTDTNSISFPWTDTEGNPVSDSDVSFKDGRTEADLRREVIEQYDNLERIRIVDYNNKLHRAVSRRAIKRWTRNGTEVPSDLGELPKYQMLVRAADVLEAETQRNQDTLDAIREFQVEETDLRLS